MTKASDGEALLAFQLAAVGISFIKEYRFHAKRMWRLDFAIFVNASPYDKLAVEVEGGTWSKGRHTSGKGFEADCEKYNEAAILGWRVLRFTTQMVEDGRALQAIERALEVKP